MGVKEKGVKEVVGMWVGKWERCCLWMGVVRELKGGGVEDMVIRCRENVNGFRDSMGSILGE